MLQPPRRCHAAAAVSPYLRPAAGGARPAGAAPGRWWRLGKGWEGCGQRGCAERPAAELGFYKLMQHIPEAPAARQARGTCSECVKLKTPPLPPL